MQEVANCDLVSIVRHLRDVCADIVIQGQLSLICEDRDTHRDKLFGDRTDPKDGLRRYRDVVIQVCQAITFGVDDPPIHEDPHHRTRSSRPIPFCEELIDLSCDLCARIGLS